MMITNISHVHVTGMEGDITGPITGQMPPPVRAVEVRQSGDSWCVISYADGRAVCRECFPTRARAVVYAMSLHDRSLERTSDHSDGSEI